MRAAQIETLIRLRASFISHPELRLGNTRVRDHGRSREIGQQMRPAHSACSRPLSCSPSSLVSDVFLSLQMIHSTELDMTEKGTEGDAITIVGYNFMSAKLKPVFVKFEDQFLYIVLDQGDLWIHVMGKVINPSEK